MVEEQSVKPRGMCQPSGSRTGDLSRMQRDEGPWSQYSRYSPTSKLAAVRDVQERFPDSSQESVPEFPGKLFDEAFEEYGIAESRPALGMDNSTRDDFFATDNDVPAATVETTATDNPSMGGGIKTATKRVRARENNHTPRPKKRVKDPAAATQEPKMPCWLFRHCPVDHLPCIKVNERYISKLLEHLGGHGISVCEHCGSVCRKEQAGKDQFKQHKVAHKRCAKSTLGSQERWENISRLLNPAWIPPPGSSIWKDKEVETEYRKKALAATNSTTSCSNTTSTASTMASSVPEQALLVVLCGQTLHLDPSSARDRELWLELVQKLASQTSNRPSSLSR